MGKLFKKVAPYVGPALALSGVGAPLAIGLGAAAGGLSGGGLRGALAGGIGGAAGLGGSLGGALSSAGGLGLSAGAAGALGSGLIGAAAGGVGGGTKGALLGAGLGGAGGYIQGSGGFTNAYNNAKDAIGLSGSGAGSSGVAGLGTPGTSPVMGGGGSSYDTTGLGGITTSASAPAATSPVFSSAPAATPSLGGITAATPAATTTPSFLDSAMKYSPLISPVLSAGIGTVSNDMTADALLEQQAKSQELLSPFLQSKFEPGDLTQDPGYQFQLAQGNQALDRAQSARGNYFSGEALQAAQDYGQGLAGTAYADAYKRYLADQQQKLGVAGALTGVYDNVGNINANKITNTANTISAGAAGVLGGNGFNNQGQSFNQNALIAALLARQGAY